MTVPKRNNPPARVGLSATTKKTIDRHRGHFNTKKPSVNADYFRMIGEGL